MFFIILGVKSIEDMCQLLPMWPRDNVITKATLAKNVIADLGGGTYLQHLKQSAKDLLLFLIDVDLCNLPVKHLTRDEIIAK